MTKADHKLSKTLFYQNIICFDWVMNVFLFCGDKNFLLKRVISSHNSCEGWECVICWQVGANGMEQSLLRASWSSEKSLLKPLKIAISGPNLCKNRGQYGSHPKQTKFFFQKWQKQISFPKLCFIKISYVLTELWMFFYFVVMFFWLKRVASSHHSCVLRKTNNFSQLNHRLPCIIAVSNGHTLKLHICNDKHAFCWKFLTYRFLCNCIHSGIFTKF